MRFKVFPFEGKWQKAFGRPERSGVWFIWGKSANGKTSFAMQLCKYLCKFERVVYNSLEEGDSMTMQKTLQRFDMIEVNRRFTVTKEPMVEFNRRLLQKKSPNIAVIDSLQCTKLTYNRLRSFVEKHPNKLIIIISRARGIHPSGEVAAEAKYDADLKVYVEGFRAFNNGRTTGEDGFFDVWAERAQKYWPINNS